MSFVAEKFRKVKLGRKKNADSAGAKSGIRMRLYAAFGAIALLTLVAGLVGWTQFNNLGQALQDTTNKSANSIELAYKLSQSAEAAVSVVPNILKADSRKDLDVQTEIANTHLAALDENVVALNGEDIDFELVGQIQEKAAELETGINDLKSSVEKLLDQGAAARDFTEITTMRHKEITAIIEPYVEILRQNMSAETTDLSFEDNLEKVQEGVVKLIEQDVEIYGRAINLMSNLNMSAALLNRMNVATDLTTLKELEDEFTVYSTRLKISLLLPDFEGKAKLSDLAVKLADSAGREGGILENRRAYIKTLGEVQQISFGLKQGVEAMSEVVGKISEEIKAGTAAAIKAADEQITQGKVILATISIASLVFAVLIAWLYVGRNLMKRLNALVRDMTQIAGGDLNTEVAVAGSDEITAMATALVGFRDNAREAEQMRVESERQRREREEAEHKAEQEAREAEERARAEKERLEQEAEVQRKAELTKLADDFEGSVKHLVESFASATTQMEASSDVMSNAASDTEQRSGSVSAASDVASASVDSVAAATEELTSSINEISRQVGQAANIANGAVTEAERTNQMVTSLNEAASRIGDVVGLINDIAGQTNLLALNATIEAARAGDAGKGFAVVASEVKNLASQTAKATEEISSQIKAVQDETSSAVGAIGSITSTIGQINEIATSIASAVEEQGAATGEISRSVQQAAQSTQEVSRNIEGVNQAAQTTGATAGEVKLVSASLSKEVTELEAEVNNFLARVRA
ncbi:HAMP domain-containing protein [Sneathiella sp. P13V-1]|uniref:methyl-accepting chemotaxis protein n=1 Tax=Sneathiella sp. P13V-1 TaxID=2697366 RepID=UPI00187BA58E|nr:HAMP domain-containing methyl-accepting chemotaxis protein [Sneathiella sp. P13V-1]MBE7637909.1 HAMP domain-containing protein [Sneathiella sp. P13V-1]